MNDVWTGKPFVGTLSDVQPLSLVLVNGTEDEAVWDHMVRTWHYLGYDKMIGQRLKYLVLSRNVPIAAISFNRTALRVACAGYVVRVARNKVGKNSFPMWLTTTDFSFCHGFTTKTWLLIYWPSPFAGYTV